MKAITYTASARTTADLLADALGEPARDLYRPDRHIAEVLRADYATLAQTPGIGERAYIRLQAMRELVDRAATDAFVDDGTILHNPNDARKFVAMKMRGLEHEHFGALYLDNRHKVIAFKIEFVGTIDGASVHPRTLAKNALRCNAAAVILAHNHPSGSHEPSKADENITREIKKVLEMIDIRVLDHFIIGDKTVSMQERSLI